MKPDAAIGGFTSPAVGLRRVRVGLVVALTAALLGGARWLGPDYQTYPDTYWYARQALVDAGSDGTAATRQAMQIVCSDPLRKRDLRSGSRWRSVWGR